MKRKETPATPHPGPIGYDSAGTGGHDVTQLFPDAEPVGRNIGGMVPPGGVHDSVGYDPRVRVLVKIRAGKRWSEIMTRVKQGEYTWEEFASTLSPTELARGQIKDKHGGFKGRPPTLVPAAFHNACIRELMARGQRAYRENYMDAIKAMTSIANSTIAKDSDRIKAAQFVIERLEGKVPERLEISQVNPMDALISGIVAEAEDKAIANAQDYLERL